MTAPHETALKLMGRIVKPRFIGSASELIDHADAFLIDQFGTLHNGSVPYPGTIAALRALHAAGRKLIVLSNSGRRAAPNMKRLEQLGFPSGLFDACISSGEVAWRTLRADPPPYLRGRCRVYLVARDACLDILEGFDIVRVERAEEADVVVIAGSEADRMDFEELVERMGPAIAKRVPAICTNPDREMIVGARLFPSAGRIAEEYGRRGGHVCYFGKPYRDVYQAAYELLPGIAPSRILMIGDSLEHDVRGAADAGCQSLLVLTGLLARKSLSEVEDIIRSVDPQPDFIAASLA